MREYPEVNAEEMLIAVEDDVARFVERLEIGLEVTLNISVTRHHLVLDALEPQHLGRRKDRADVLELNSF